MNTEKLLRNKIISIGQYTGMILSAIGSMIYTATNISNQLYRMGIDLVLSTFRFNLTTLLEAVLMSLVPAIFSGMLIGYWIWADFTKGLFSRKRSIQKGIIIGVIAGVLFSIFVIYNSDRRLALQSFYIELSMQLILWVASGGVIGWRISKFISEDIANN